MFFNQTEEVKKSLKELEVSENSASISLVVNCTISCRLQRVIA